eukprot:XP_011675906.1 PREDICTED: uncharacterized protein LOC105443917 [Strongylocentrotus purpuratus]
MAIKSILSGKCSPLNFELQFSPEEKGKKNVQIDILQGSATRAERKYIITIEDEPDYAVDHTDSKGRLQYVSNNLLEILADLIHTPKDLKSLGYQLGFSSSSMEKYNDQTDVSFDSVSRLGFGKMLCDWRRQVRQSEQVDELHLALQKAGLGHAAEVIIHDVSSRRRFAQVRQVWESKK